MLSGKKETIKRESKGVADTRRRGIGWVSRVTPFSLAGHARCGFFFFSHFPHPACSLV